MLVATVLMGIRATSATAGVLLRAYPRTPDRGIRVRWGQIRVDRTERAAGVVGAYVEDPRRRTERKWSQNARRPTEGVLA